MTYYIVNVKKSRIDGSLYGELRDENDEIVISAKLDYIFAAIELRGMELKHKSFRKVPA